MSNREDIVSGTVYGLHEIGGAIRYIGITVANPDKRFSAHGTRARAGHNNHLYCWMRKVGVENVRMTIIEYYSDIPLKDLYAREIKLISEYRDNGYDLTNTLVGGGGSAVNRTHPETTREKMSKAQSGSNHSQYGKPKSPETRAKISATIQGTKFSEERKVTVRRGLHKRYHTYKGIIKPDCSFCITTPHAN